MRLTLVAILLACCGALCAFEPPQDGYELHEWGVFPVARNDAWAMRDLRAEWATFPKFFNRVWPEKSLPWRGEVSKPVIFMYAAKSQTIDLKVSFATGRPLVWWPYAESPGDTGRKFPDGDPRELKFHFSLNKGLGGEKLEAPPAVEAGHWVEILRKVGAASVNTMGDYREMQVHTSGAERFIYYDGIMKAPPAPEVARDGEALAIKTACDHAMLDVLVIERRGDKVFVSKAFLDKIEAGTQSSKVELALADAKALEALQKELTARLVKAGLTEPEADSLMKVWKEGLFDADGLMLLYRLPQETYEKWLPLTAKPAPNKTVRVGLVVHKHLEPELEARVTVLIAKLKAEAFEERNAAFKELLKIGGAAFPWLEKHLKDEDLDVAKQCRTVIEALDTFPALLDLLKKDQ